MSYFFTFEQPGRRKCNYGMTVGQMAIMVEVMRAAKCLREQGIDPNWTLRPDGVTHDKFRSNGNHLVTPDECRLIAERLRSGLVTSVVQNTLSYFDDAPVGPAGVAWVEEWARYNERAATAGGYRVK